MRLCGGSEVTFVKKSVSEGDKCRVEEDQLSSERHGLSRVTEGHEESTEADRSKTEDARLLRAQCSRSCTTH